MFQVNKVNNSKDSNHNMIIDSDIMYDLNIDLQFPGERVRWLPNNNPLDYNSIPMKELGVLSDPNVCSMIYDFHTTNPILQ